MRVVVFRFDRMRDYWGHYSAGWIGGGASFRPSGPVFEGVEIWALVVEGFGRGALFGVDRVRAVDRCVVAVECFSCRWRGFVV
jgi:hypothetical protein